MAFCHRVFCRDPSSPSVSEILMWLRQHGFQAQVAAAEDLLSAFWQRAEIAVDEGAPALGLVCLRPDAAGLRRLTEEVADFVADVRELPASAAGAQVLEHLAATRQLLVIEFPADGDAPSLERGAASIAGLFVERADGLTQRDGVGFLDEDDDLVLPLG